MHKVHPSGISPALLIATAIMLGSTMLFLIYEQVWIGFIIVALVSFLVFYLMTGIRYIIEDKALIIRVGIFYKWTIPAEKIQWIKSTKDFSSAPAGSMKRFDLHCGKIGTVVISPKDIDAFIRDLKLIQPELSVR